MSIQTYRDLEVWQKSMDLVVEIYTLSKLWPRDEQFGLVNQIRRSSVSIPANIAEGQGRLHKADFVRFLSIARGSLTETETHLLIAMRLQYPDKEQAKPRRALSQEVGRLLNGLIRSLDNSNNKISEHEISYDIDYRPPITDHRPPEPYD